MNNFNSRVQWYLPNRAMMTVIIEDHFAFDLREQFVNGAEEVEVVDMHNKLHTVPKYCDILCLIGQTIYRHMQELDEMKYEQEQIELHAKAGTVYKWVRTEDEWNRNCVHCMVSALERCPDSDDWLYQKFREIVAKELKQ